VELGSQRLDLCDEGAVVGEGLGRCRHRRRALDPRLDRDDGDRLLARQLRRGGCLGRFALLLALELGPKAGAEALLRLAHLPKRVMKLSIAGPRMTMNIEGKMKSTVGKSILIGAFIAFSSAAA
jgi:hypothetical protein